MLPNVTLSTIPPELVHGTCDYLSDQDFLKLQLVSAALYSKLPHSRLDKIHSRRMVRFTDTETRKLKRLASNRPEKLSRINHLVFNLTSPHVRFIPEHLFSHWANSYSWSIRMKMLKFYHNYRERNPSERKREVIEVSQLEPGSEQLPPGQDLRPEYLLAFFSILKSIIQPSPKFDQKALFGALTEVLKLLPNLQTIEFMEDYPHRRDRHLIGLLLEEYNPSLKAFRYEAAYLDHYQRAFESLRRLEIWCSGVELDKAEKVSPLFLTTIQNVQELSFRRPLDYKNIYFIKLPNTPLPNLRRLEIISARVDLNSLQDFARTNKNSLRELILQGPCNDDMRKPEIIGFLETMGRIIDLEICQIDFVTHRKQMVGACFLLVDVKGSWREEGVACRYRVGSRCADRDERFEPRDRADWVEQQTWKEFIIEIKEVGASGLVPRYQRSMSDECMDCQDHWRRDRTW
ncbi:hypothetical protein TWF703_008776 [Orbilia oligospora]|uniref:F-box domain-containing protein n=1 Tax=Orbilia oligospora TaxID=2813651 RepID=A0A7C8JN32_ORBOL|nr:hypothetical protein TWF703_008776 [Orbilia oligospora]